MISTLPSHADNLIKTLSDYRQHVTFQQKCLGNLSERKMILKNYFAFRNSDQL